MRRRIRWLLPLLVVAGIVAAATTAAASRANPPGPPDPGKATPIKHLVVIFQENVSFDHYFGTYPHAANTSGSRSTAPAPPQSTASQHGAQRARTLLTNNPNNDDGTRSTRAGSTRPNINDVLTCDQDHNYTDEQKAFDDGNMDKFVDERRHRADGPRPNSARRAGKPTWS